MNKEILNELKKERRREIARRYYNSRKNDPEFKKRRAKYLKKYFKNLKKNNPVAYQKIQDRNRRNMAKMRQKMKMLEKMAERNQIKL